MTRFVVGRLAGAIPTLLGVILAMVTILSLAPGDPVQAIVGDVPISPEYRAAVVERYNLDAPLWERFFTYVGNLLQGDMGDSIAGGRTVASLIMSRLPATALLVGVSLTVAAVLGTALGIIAASRRGTSVDGSINTFVLIAFATPGFWLGQMLVIAFANKLGWLPSGGMRAIGSTTEGLASALEVGKHLILPAIALCAMEIAAVTRVARASAVEVYAEDYVATARLKGITRGQIRRRHVLRNALLPVLTIVGYRAGTALAGTVLIESVFSWPGMGLLLVNSITGRDNQVVIGIVLMLAVMAVIMNLITDVLYGALDPRVRG